MSCADTRSHFRFALGVLDVIILNGCWFKGLSSRIVLWPNYTGSPTLPRACLNRTVYTFGLVNTMIVSIMDWWTCDREKVVRACVRAWETYWMTLHFSTRKTLSGLHSLSLTSSNWVRASICQHICFSRTIFLSVPNIVTNSFSWCSVDLGNNKSINVLFCFLYCLYLEMNIVMLLLLPIRCFTCRCKSV